VEKLCFLVLLLLLLLLLLLSWVLMQAEHLAKGAAFGVASFSTACRWHGCDWASYAGGSSCVWWVVGSRRRRHSTGAGGGWCFC
jgi:hypothetical protein